MENNTNRFEYGVLARHLGLVYAILIIVVFLPIPIYSNLLFEHTIKEENVYILEVIGIIALIIYIHGYIKNNRVLGSIITHSDSIESVSKNITTKIKWSDVSGFKKILHNDENSVSQWGMKGVLLVGVNGDKIEIYEHIDNYERLLEIILSNINEK